MTINPGDCETAPAAPWTRTDELNWAADRSAIQVIKKRGDEPSEWLATEYRELSARRKTVTMEVGK